MKEHNNKLHQPSLIIVKVNNMTYSAKRWLLYRYMYLQYTVQNILSTNVCIHSLAYKCSHVYKYTHNTHDNFVSFLMSFGDHNLFVFLNM